MAPHSSTLAWKIPWMEEPGRLQSMGVAKSQTRLSDFTFTFHFHELEKEMATHSTVLAWRIPGTGEPDGLLSTGSHRVEHDWSDLAARRLLLVWGLYNAETKAPTYSPLGGNCWFTKGNIFRGLPRPMWSRRSTLTFSWSMLGSVQIQPLCSLSLIQANTWWYWSILSFPTKHRGVWGSWEVS